jgi:8-hydroxy-5-deazaflavin:NADPH oxidoreductase
METKKVGILGSGTVGQTLAAGFIRYGYQVMIGTRNPSKLEEWKQNNNIKVIIGSFEDTAEFGDIIVLAVKGNAAKEVLRKIPIESIQYKLVIDTTNPIADEQPVNGVLKFFTTLDKSLLETLQESFIDVQFVKAFSCVGSHFMVNPSFDNVKPTMFICGNHDNAKKEVTHILDLFGWEAEDMGAAEAARAIEPLCMLWCIPGFRKNEWSHAFKLLKK